MKHDDVIGRLRSLSRQSVDGGVASAHLDRAAAAATARSGSHQRAALVAAACLAAVALPAAGIVLARAGHGPGPTRDQPVLPGIVLSCPGEARVISDDLVGDTTAVGAADPESDELVQRRAANCPRPEDVVDSTTPAAIECLGPRSEAAITAQSVGPDWRVVPLPKADWPATQAPSHPGCRTATSNTPTTTTGTPPTSTTVGLLDPASAADADSAQAPNATQPSPPTTMANPSHNGDGSAGNLLTPPDAEGPPPGASNSAAGGDHPANAGAPADVDPDSGVPGPPDNVPAAQPGRAPVVPGPPEGVPEQAAGGNG